jgi:hypothetical protein
MGLFPIPSSLINPHGFSQRSELSFLTNYPHYEVWYEIKSYEFITWPLGLSCNDDMSENETLLLSNMSLLVWGSSTDTQDSHKHTGLDNLAAMQ